MPEVTAAGRLLGLALVIAACTPKPPPPSGYYPRPYQPRPAPPPADEYPDPYGGAPYGGSAAPDPSLPPYPGSPGAEPRRP